MPLCMPGGAHLDHLPAGLERPGRGASARSRSSGSSRSNAASGSGSRRVCTAYGEALVLDPGVGGVGRGAASGAGRAGRTPARAAAAGRRSGAAWSDQRSLPYWPKTKSSLPCVAERVPDLLEPAEVEHLAGRAAGDHRDRGDHLGEVDQHVAGVGVDVRLLRVVDDRGQGAVEVQADDGPARRTAPASAYSLLRLGGGELHGHQPITPSRVPAGMWRTAQPSGAVRITVSRSRRIGSTAGAVRSIPRSRASAWPPA